MNLPLLLSISASNHKTFRKRLLAWFEASKRDLPWRVTAIPTRIWISEVMLQQTRVAAVIPYFERFLERFPTIEALASAPEEDLLKAWAGLGYYSRARNLQRAAIQMNGSFPRGLRLHSRAPRCWRLHGGSRRQHRVRPAACRRRWQRGSRDQPGDGRHGQHQRRSRTLASITSRPGDFNRGHDGTRRDDLPA